MSVYNIDQVKEYLRSYRGPQISIMEVCGSHTGAIARLGIDSLLSDRIRLRSGPGCPVCVTPSAYIDRLIAFSKEPDTVVVTFGDLLRVPGSRQTLSQARGEGGRVEMVYSPADVIRLARDHRDLKYIFAAVGFETTMPVYSMIMDQLLAEDIPNVRLLTALKTMPEAITYLCEKGARVDGFLAPGHVAVVTGSKSFEPLAGRYRIPFAVTGFTGENILMAIYGLVKSRGQAKVMNFYPSVVTSRGNVAAQEEIDKYFSREDSVWRGMGRIPGSGRFLKEEYAAFDAGSRQLTEDHKINPSCCCDRVLMGLMSPRECPLFGKACTPLRPQGACMVSEEGNCRSYYVNQRQR